MYAKLFRDVISSSLTQRQPIEVRGVFFMMLALAERDGEVRGDDATIARLINVPIDIFERAVQALSLPESTRRPQPQKGRRIIPLENSDGYLIVNYTKYRDMRTDEDLREYWREKKQKQRQAAISQNRVSGINIHFPTDEKEAIAHAAFVGCTEQFAAHTWNKAMSRNGCDARGQKITSFRHYLATEHTYHREREAEKPKKQKSTLEQTVINVKSL